MERRPLAYLIRNALLFYKGFHPQGWQASGLRIQVVA
jgi:hypothetical protein